MAGLSLIRWRRLLLLCAWRADALTACIHPCTADVTSGVNTREKLKARDPRLASVLAAVYCDGSWRYPASAPRPFSKRAPQGALETQQAQRQQQQKQQQGGGAHFIEVLVEAEEHDQQLSPLLPDSGTPLSDSVTPVAGSLGRRGGRHAAASPTHRTAGKRKGRGPLSRARRRFMRAVSRVAGACFGCVCLPT